MPFSLGLVLARLRKWPGFFYLVGFQGVRLVLKNISNFFRPPIAPFGVRVYLCPIIHQTSPAGQNADKMSAITYFPEEGGHIDFQYDNNKFYAVSQHGTSTPLWEGELVFVPKKRCSCTDNACTKQETHFTENEVVRCLVQSGTNAGSASSCSTGTK